MQGGQISSDIEGCQPGLTRTFLLRRLGTEPHCPSVSVDFSPTTRPALPDAPSQLRLTHPTFNQDGSFFTPAFVLDVDREKYVSNSLFYFNLHEAKKEELSTEKTDLLVPKPSKGSSLCCICRTVFEDYLTHVNIPIHQTALRKSQFTSSITQLCLMFNSPEVQQPPKRGPKKHSRKIQKVDKPKKVRRDLESTSLGALKLQLSQEAKTRQTLV